MVFEMKFTLGKPMIHVEQKKISSKNRVRNLEKSTNENSISIKASNDASKNTSTVREKMTAPSKKTKKLLLLYVLLRFCMVFYGF